MNLVDIVYLGPVYFDESGRNGGAGESGGSGEPGGSVDAGDFGESCG